MTDAKPKLPRKKTERAKNNRPKNQPLSDNVFKGVTEQQGQNLGLQSIGGELQLHKSTRSDLVLQVPTDVSLKDTLFDFFSPLNVIEFKSEDDKMLDDHEFYKNVIRVYTIYEQYKKLGLDNILNVVVSAAVPQKFLSFMEEKGYNFKEVVGRKWLRREKFGNQEVALVICELLPVEPKYYPWLLFAPSDSLTWRKYMQELILNRYAYRDLFQEAIAFRLKQVSEVYEEVLEMARSGKAGLSKIETERLEAFREILNKGREQGDKFLLNGILSTFPAKERLEGLKPAERLEGLKPAERLEGLKPEEVLENFKPAEREMLLKLLLEQQAKKIDTDTPEN